MNKSTETPKRTEALLDAYKAKEEVEKGEIPQEFEKREEKRLAKWMALCCYFNLEAAIFAWLVTCLFCFYFTGEVYVSFLPVGGGGWP